MEFEGLNIYLFTNDFIHLYIKEFEFCPSSESDKFKLEILDGQNILFSQELIATDKKCTGFYQRTFDTNVKSLHLRSSIGQIRYLIAYFTTKS